ncbi:serine/arginine repetitive matrix protein 2-like [Palaemon carinicauda]|uniref:serine/arginine repetitive matrix protein 2-like n=1 Tax=Palaemon carinicauda TaxID=392227 RepID=UPI0035B5B1B0
MKQQLWASLGLQGSPSREALFDMIKLGAAVKQSPTTAGIDPLSVVDVVVTEASGVSSQTPVPVVAEGVRRRLFGSSSPQSSAEETTRRLPFLPATTLDFSGERSRSPSEEDRPSGPCDQSPSKPADLPSPFKDADAQYALSKPVITQAPVPSGHKGLERKTAPQTLKRQVKPARHHAAAAVPDLALQRSPARVRAPVPVMRQGSPARPQPTTRQRPPAVLDLARQRPPVPVTSRAVQEAPRLAHRRSQVPLDSQRTSGVGREARPSRAVPDTAHMRSPTHQRASTIQRAVQEVPKLAHGRSQVPLDSPSRLRNPVRAPPVARDVPVVREAPPTKQRTPVRRNPIARPSQQRTPACPYPDSRPRSPARPALPRSPQVNIPAQTAQRSPARQRADPPSRYHEAGQSRPRPIFADTRPRATAHSRPTVPHQVTARPRIQPSTPPRDLAPARHTPSPSPTRAHAHAPAPSPARHCATNLARPREREIPTAYDPFMCDPGQGSSRDLQRDRRQADRSSSRSPPCKRRTAHSPEEKRFPDRSKDSLISASLQANPLSR